MIEKRFTLRMDEKIFKKVKEQAEKDKRSIAKEIEFILEHHLVEIEEKRSNHPLTRCCDCITTDIK